MARTPETNNRPDFNPEALDPYVQAQKAEEVLSGTIEFADAKEALARSTFEDTHNVGVERKNAAGEDIDIAEKGRMFEEEKYAKQFELGVAGSADIYEAVLEEPVNRDHYFRQADSNLAGAREELIEGAQGAAGAYRSATSDNNGVSAIA